MVCGPMCVVHLVPKSTPSSRVCKVSIVGIVIIVWLDALYLRNPLDP